MLRRIQSHFVLIALFVATLTPAHTFGQVLQMVAVGDATQAATWANAAHLASAANNNYTIDGLTPAGGPFTAMIDVRVNTQDQGSLWVVWDNTPFPNTNIWCYITEPSMVAARGFDAVPRSILFVNAAVQGTPGYNLLPFSLPPDAPALPAPIYNAVANAVFNAAMIGLTPAQAKAETNRLLAMPAAPPAKYGYGPGPVGFPIQNVFNPVVHFPVVFSTAGVDPITHLGVPATITTPLRDSLVVPIVNATNVVPPGGIGSFIAANHNVFVPCNSLGAGLSGILDTTQLFGAAGAGNGLMVFLDDPLSDSWYVMETKAYAGGCGSQEMAVVPPGPPFDPLALPGPGGIRVRVAGREDALIQEGATPDSLTYVSWTCSLAGAGTYISVSGKKPFPGPGFGAFPPCPVATNAGYSLRTKQNVVTDNPVPAGVGALIGPVVAMAGPNLNWQ